jgi:hypothetical protein
VGLIPGGSPPGRPDPNPVPVALLISKVSSVRFEPPTGGLEEISSPVSFSKEFSVGIYGPCVIYLIIQINSKSTLIEEEFSPT